MAALREMSLARHPVLASDTVPEGRASVTSGSVGSRWGLAMTPSGRFEEWSAATDELTDERVERLRHLCDAAFAGRFDDHDFEHAKGGLHVGVDVDGTPVGHAAVVPRALYVGERSLSCGYVEAFVVLPEFQRRGLGTTILDRVNLEIRGRYEVGALSTSVTSFYARRGWRTWLGPTCVVRDGALERTPDEDGGVMVLIWGDRPALDEGEQIAVDGRAGDDW